MRYRKNKTFALLAFLFAVHLIGILFFTVFRIILYFCNLDQTAGITGKTALFCQAMLNGLQFDNLTASYISFLPLIATGILVLFRKTAKINYKILTIYYTVVYTVVFGIAIADIPYFGYFLAHIKTDALGWLQFASTTAGMVFEEISNYPFLALEILSVAAFYFIIRKLGKRLYRHISDAESKINLKWHIPVMIFAISLCILGMRGTFKCFPLRTIDAFFTSYSFYNQLGVNPAFSFMKSIKDVTQQKRNVNDLMSLDDALSTVQKELNASAGTVNPIERKITAAGNPSNANVVIILLESMAYECLNAKGFDGKILTPFLNDLIDRSYYFDHFYSSGIHTNNGIVSTLYGYPTIFDRPSILSNPHHYTGLPVNLKKAGYHTMFFLTSNPAYDNMQAFLCENGFERIYSQFDYPKEKIVNNFGVQDDYLLEYGLNTLNEIAAQDKPFAACFLTVSKHPPYVVPPQYEDIAENEEECMLAFVDNSLKYFMEGASKQDWFNNTYFVLLGDHGAVMGAQKYGMALTYNHIPCIIYSPLLEDAPKRFSGFGGQIDIFPTLMGLLNRSYTNDSFGIDLLKENRPCMFFVSNNQLGCIDDNYFYVRDLDVDFDFLYDLKSTQPDNKASDLPEIISKLKKYAVSMTVAADRIMRQ
jgi:phosphoglycerol transferase MdoB-like AlkP superfamily enzyme